ncbi:ParB/RepB/Spo0J family partition protein [Parasedimentitalea marina]|nr:ParB N-terminal domain-containing protein [Parasedimentitalea marina]
MRHPNWQKIDTLPVTSIQVEERLRTASPTGVASIVSSISEVGRILQPLLVRKVNGGYRLMDGLHRLCAAQEIGLEEVPVSVSNCTLDQAIRIEVDANVAGAPLSALDMAVFLAAHKALYEKDHPEAARGSAGGRAKNGVPTDIMSVSSFAANASEVFDKGERHIRRLISVGGKLSREEISQLRNAPKRIQFTDLELIAKCGEATDRANICRALGDGTAKSAKEVLARKKSPGTAVKDPVEAARRKLNDAYSRAPKEARRRFAEDHRDELLELLGKDALVVSDEALETDAEIVPFTSKRAG